jgi:uncharacterized protein with NRDE domain
MCLILISYRHHAGFELIVAANRDESFGRETRPARFWPEAPAVLAGRDRAHGGTWLGITRHGRLAAITNVREPAPHDPAAPSRGALVADFLCGDQPAQAYAARVHETAAAFNGFNLLLYDGRELVYVSNRAGAPQVLGPGLYGVSNHLLDTPWHKIRRGKAALAGLQRSEPIPWLLELLHDPRPAPEDELPDTGLPRARERALSASHIPAAPGADGLTLYGTRCATAITVSDTGHIGYSERSFAASGEITTIVSEEFARLSPA